MGDQGSISRTIFFSRNSNSMGNLPCCNSITGLKITTNFCTCHDSTAVLPCAKFCCNHGVRIELNLNCHGNTVMSPCFDIYIYIYII